MKCDNCGRNDCQRLTDYATERHAQAERIRAAGGDVLDILDILETPGPMTWAQRLGDCQAATRARAERAEALLAVMLTEANRWASMGWRDTPTQSCEYAAGANDAAEAIAAAGGGWRE